MRRRDGDHNSSALRSYTAYSPVGTVVHVIATFFDAMKSQQSCFVLAIAVLLAATKGWRNADKPSVGPKALRMRMLRDENLQNELLSTDVVKISASSVSPVEKEKVKRNESKDEVDQMECDSLSTEQMPQKTNFHLARLYKQQNHVPKEVIDQFIDTCIIPWLKKNGNVECRGNERRKLERKLDKMLCEAGYSVAQQDIPSLNQEELEKLPRVDIAQISNAEKMSSEEVRLELVQQAMKERKRALFLKVRDLIRVERGVICQYTRNGKTNTIGDLSSQHPDRVNARDQNNRDDPIGKLRKIIEDLKKRSKLRGHPFNLIEVLPYLIDALLGVKFDADDGIGRCGCQGNHKPCHNGKVQLMANGGGYGISFDRLDDKIGYNQPLVVVCDLCNKRVKPDRVPIKRSERYYVISETVKNLMIHTKRRIEGLLKKSQKKEKKLSEDEKQHLHRWEHVYDNGMARSAGRKRLKEEYTATFTKKYNAIRNGDRCCPDCGIQMDTGTDEEIPMFIYKYNPRQISPDRINDLDPFYVWDNYNLCCLACQASGRVVKNEKDKPIPFTIAKRDEMVHYLKDLQSGKEQQPAMVLY